MSDLAFFIFLIITQIIPGGIFFLILIWKTIMCIRDSWNAQQPRAPVALAEGQGAALAMLAAIADNREAAAKRAARPAVLPYFAYPAQEESRASETLCAICVEPLRPGQHCSEVPACRHAFHRDCLGVWARSKGTCPLCRAEIVRGSDGVVEAALDMV